MSYLIRSLHPFRTLRKDVSLSAVLAGCLAALIGYAGPLAVVYQAASAAQLSAELTTSWIWAISIGSGVSGLVLSWRLRTPVLAAWSTPGAALLVGLLPGTPFPEALGAFAFSATLMAVLGWSGWFDRAIDLIPPGIAAGLLAGILFRFGTQVFTHAHSHPVLVMGMVLAYVLAKRCCARYAIAVVMATGVALAWTLGMTELSRIEFEVVRPVFTWPQWNAMTLLNIGLPLALVTLVGQHVPGMAVLRGAGYPVKAKGIVGLTGFVSFLLTPLGCHSVNLSAITAAICTGQEAHENPARRYPAGLANGLLCIALGIFGGALTGVFQALPPQLIGTLAGLALLGAIGNGLVGVATDTTHREASVLTFVVAASGMELLGLGSAFWALVMGAAACLMLHPLKMRTF